MKKYWLLTLLFSFYIFPNYTLACTPAYFSVSDLLGSSETILMLIFFTINIVILSYLYLKLKESLLSHKKYIRWLLLGFTIPFLIFATFVQIPYVYFILEYIVLGMDSHYVFLLGTLIILGSAYSMLSEKYLKTALISVGMYCLIAYIFAKKEVAFLGGPKESIMWLLGKGERSCETPGCLENAANTWIGDFAMCGVPYYAPIKGLHISYVFIILIVVFISLLFLILRKRLSAENAQKINSNPVDRNA